MLAAAAVVVDIAAVLAAAAVVDIAAVVAAEELAILVHFRPD